MKSQRKDSLSSDSIIKRNNLFVFGFSPNVAAVVVVVAVVAVLVLQLHFSVFSFMLKRSVRPWLHNNRNGKPSLETLFLLSSYLITSSWKVGILASGKPDPSRLNPSIPKAFPAYFRRKEWWGWARHGRWVSYDGSKWFDFYLRPKTSQLLEFVFTLCYFLIYIYLFQH